jgi:hypothetical protein
MKIDRMNLCVALAAAVGMAACDGSAVSPSGSRGAQVTMSLTTASSALISSSVRAALVPSVDVSGHKLDIARVQLVLRDVDLKRVEDDACETGHDGCAKFKAGPVLIDLPLSGGVITPFSEKIAPGTYDRVELKVHEPDDDNGARAAFYAAHPDWQKKATVRVTGTYDSGTGAQPFDIYLAANLEVKQDITPPVTVDSATSPSTINLTLGVDVDSWFRTASGALIDPRSTTADRQLLNVVTENVKRSFRAVRDDDRNGDEDHGGDRGKSGKGGDDKGGDDKGSGGHGSDDGAGHN